MNAWTVSSAVAGNRRDELAQFWLAAPDDILENLWHSPVGDATRQLVAQLTPSTYFTPAQVELRNRLGRELEAGLQQPGAVKRMIANFLFSPPGQMRIANAQANLPGWLVPGYAALYEQGQSGFIQQPAQPAPFAAPAPAQPSMPRPDFGTFPNSLQEFASNRIQLNRLLGLSNLYYIDPEDQEILQELRQLRLQLSQLILDCPEQQLEGLFSTDLADRYWALVRSGVQKEALQPAEDQLKNAVTTKLSPSNGGGFGTPGAMNAFLVAMAFYEPGSMQVEGAEHKLPAWLLPGYREVFAQALPA
ncbi:MAG: hypothetical protein KXJ50_08365 [Vulcanococcus sp.]|jgi:hypothetical protein|uniref:hypothetical protein n=1 Tax=Vulcanococcus sp. TaxID=2856995 RepID=UPI0025CD6551|nr:hypothetical protein [Vulcanococcus sp.]MBW0181064.1 hypothetical protein [Vulcanococcus sp.]